MDASSSNRTRAIIAQVHQSNSNNNSSGSNNSSTGKPIKQKHRHHHHHHHHNHNQQQQHQQQQYFEHQQLQHNPRQQNDNVQTLCTNGCRFHYDSSSPSFPDLTPPIDMPQQQQTTTNNVLQLTQQQQQQQQHSHHSKSMNRNKPQFPDDPDTIEFCLDEEPAAAQKYYKECSTTNNRNKHKNYEPHVRWSRNNIAVTMERFQPIASPSSASESSSCASSCHQDYSYAYYEPGAIMCHSNIPTPDDVAGPSTALPPPNSMRALLLKTKEKSHKTLPANRHTYTTRYGTHENIYEDVSDEKNTRLVSSEQSLSERGCTKKEFQHILNNHYRVLEELNLSVEELLMSTTPPQSEPSPLIQRTATAQINGNGGGSPIVVTTGINGGGGGGGHVNGNGSSNSSTTDILSNQLASIEIKDETRSPISEIIIGEDSGFSGSSSGASYIGSLRNYKTAITRSLRRSSAPNCVAANSNTKTVYGSCRAAKFPQDIRQGSFYNGINNNCINGNNSNSCNNNGNNNNCNLIMPSNNTMINCKSDKCHQAVDDHNPQQKGVKFSLWSKRS